MKSNKVSNVILFLCLGLILLTLILIYNLNTRILSLEEEILPFKKQRRTIGNRFKNYDYLKNKDFLTDDNFDEFQKLVIDYMKNNISEMVSEEPALGGKWIVSDIKFLSPDIIKVSYEDGHIGDVMFLKIESAVDSKIVIKPFW